MPLLANTPPAYPESPKLSVRHIVDPLLDFPSDQSMLQGRQSEEPLTQYDLLAHTTVLFKFNAATSPLLLP